MSSLDSIIARGLPAIDPAGDYYKLKDLMQTSQLNRLKLQQEQQLYPLKVQEAQQQQQIRQAALDKVQRQQRAQQRVMEISQDPTLEGNPDKILTRLIGDPNIDPDTYWSYAGNVTKAHTDRTAQAKSAVDLAKAHQEHNAGLAFGVAQNGFNPAAFGGYLHQAVTDGSLTEDQAKEIERQHREAPDPDAFVKQHILAQMGPSVTPVYNAAQEATLKQTAEKKATRMQEALQASYAIQDDPSLQAWQTAYPEFKNLVPSSATYKTDTPQVIRMRLAVPVKEQPDLEMKQRQADAMAGMKPEDWDAQVDNTIPATGDTQALNKRTRSLVRGAVSMGLPLTAVQAVIKDASDQIGRTETGVRTAKATAPIKIQVAGAEQAAKASAGGLTEDDKQRAGEQYMRTGVMPAMGRDSATRAQIVHYGNQWARENGFSTAQIVAMQAAYTGDKDSLKNFQKQRDQIVSFEQTAQKNLDLFLDAASKIPDMGVPWLNMPLRDLSQSIVGSGNMAAVNAARTVANNEIAKVTSGGGMSGVLSDAARHEVASYNPANATYAQTLAVARILKADMANRHQSMDATLDDIKVRLGGAAPKAESGTAPKVKVWNQQNQRFEDK